MGLGQDLDRLERSGKISRKEKKAISSIYSGYGSAVRQISNRCMKREAPNKENRYLAVRMLRPQNYFFFDMDYHGRDKQAVKGHALIDLLTEAQKDFPQGYFLSESTDGFHLIGKIKEEDQPRLLRKYKELFKEADYDGTSIRILPKINALTGKPRGLNSRAYVPEENKDPRTVYSTLDWREFANAVKREKRFSLEPYYTNP